jgi:hypothetical protein
MLERASTLKLAQLMQNNQRESTSGVVLFDPFTDL